MANSKDILLRVRVRKDESIKEIERLKKEIVGIKTALTKYQAKVNSVGKSSKNAAKNIHGMRLATAGLRRTVGAIRNELLIFAFVLTTIKSTLSFAKEARDIARDGEEIQSKFNVVFGDMSKSVDEWARDFAKSVGRFGQDVKKWLAGLQDTFKPLGFGADKAAALSENLVKLAVDVASFNNKMDEDVIRDFTSALVGNHETVRKYGILISESSIAQEAINQGYNKTYAQLTDLEKVQLRYNIILKSSTDAQGDAIRTADSDANLEKRRIAAKKELYEHIGQKLIPISKAYNSTLIDLYQSLMPVVDKVRLLYSEINQFKIKEKTLADYISQYEELKEITTPTVEEQKKLKDVVTRIAEIMPAAITGIDNYGNAIDVNIGRIKELIKLEKARIRLLEREAIEMAISEFRKKIAALAEYNTQLKATNESIDRMNDPNSGFNAGANPFSTDDAKIVDYLITGATEHIAELTEKSKAATEEMDELVTSLAGFLDVDADKKTIATSLGLNLEEDIVLVEMLHNKLQSLQDTESPNSKPTKEIDLDENEKIKIVTDYYNAVKWLDDNYYNYRIGLIDQEIAKMRDAGMTEAEILLYRNTKVRELNDELISEYSSSADAYLKEMQEKADAAAAEIEQRWTALSNILGNIFYEVLGGAFDNIEEMFVNMIKRMLAETMKYLFLILVTGGNITTGGFLSAILGLHKGGSVENRGEGNINIIQGPGFANGIKDFIVPPGFANDSYPIFVESGERVTVTPVSAMRSIPANYNSVISPINYFSNTNNFSDQQIVGLLRNILDVNRGINAKKTTVNLFDQRPLIGNLSQESKRRLSFIVDEGKDLRF